MNTAPVEESETAANSDTGETSVTLLAPAPIDDGGIKIDGYIIDMRHVGNGMPDTWTTLGSRGRRRAGGLATLQSRPPHSPHRLQFHQRLQPGQSIQ